MDRLKRTCCKDRQQWRSWFESHHLSESGVWLVYYKKQSKKPSVSYDDAVEEAICFGWIDGQVRRIDDERYMQRYTPRKPKSCWSVINIGRAKRMIAQGRMTADGLRAFRDGMKNQRVVPSSKDFSVPTDLRSALKKNRKALRNFDALPASAQLAYAHWVDSAKRDETRQKRIKKTVEMAAQNKRLSEA